MPAAKMVKYCFIISTVSWSGMLQREEGNDHQFCACQLECLAEADDFFSRTKFTNAGFTGGEHHQSCRTQIGADDFQTRQDAISVLFSQRCGVVIVTRLHQAAAQQQVAIDRFRLLGVGCGILSHLNRGVPSCRLWFECCSAVSPWEILDEAIRDREGRAVGAEALEEHESTQVESQSGK